MISTESMQRIYVQVALGTPKIKSPFSLTKEESEFWDQLADEVREIKAFNGVLDFPDLEVPTIEVPKVREIP